MNNFSQETQNRLVLGGAIVLSVTVIALAITSWQTLGGLIFVLLLAVSLSFLFDRLKPFSRYKEFRRKYPVSEEVIDKYEKISAQDEVSLIAHEAKLTANLKLPLSMLQKAKDILEEFDKIQTQHLFQGDPKLEPVFQKMIEKALRDTEDVYKDMDTKPDQEASS